MEPNKYILDSLETLDTGVFYAKTTVTNSAGTVLFTDCIGFVIRKDVTTKIEGSYHRNITTGNDFNVSTGTNTGTDTTNTVDIKEWGGNEFSDGGIYKITESDGKYEFVCSEPSNRNKILEEKNIVIDLNGKKLINIYSNNKGQQTRVSKTYFTISSGASLKIINSESSPSIYGFESGIKFFDATLIPSFIVDSGTLSIGSNISTSISEDSESLRHITITGCLPGAPNSETKGNAPIVISEKGGTVNLYGNSAGVTITETCKGISTISDTSASNLAATNVFNATINMSNASINASGYGNTPQGNKTVVVNNYGIYLNGFGKKGKIVINVGDSNHSASIKSSGSSGEYKNYGIYIENFTGDIEINISKGSTIDAGSGYGIFINCPEATAKITNAGTITGTISNNAKSPSTI